MKALKKIPRAPSVGEAAMAQHLILNDIDFVREFRFSPPRKWRFDFVILPWDRNLAVEIDGGTWTRGRHNRTKGMENDNEKINAAQAMGWRVFKFTTRQVMSLEAIETIREVLRESAVSKVDKGWIA